MLVGILQDPAKGIHFLDWSIHYLSGQTDLFNWREQKNIPLTNSPLNKETAHNHVSNHPHTSDEITQALEICKSYKKFSSVCSEGLTYNNNSLEATNINMFSAYCDKIILLVSPDNTVLYDCKYQSRSQEPSASLDRTKTLYNDNERFNDFVNTFFHDSVELWKNTGFDKVWDRREFIALNFNFFNNQTLTKFHNLKFDHYLLSAVDLWTQFDNTVESVLEYLNLKLDRSRWGHWLDVYNVWKIKHHSRLNFCWYFNEIVDSIVSGRYINLGRFDLDIMQEAAIQQALIKQHNLNLKTWQLEKFEDTLQLHNLLEKNFHPIA